MTDHHRSAPVTARGGSAPAGPPGEAGGRLGTDAAAAPSPEVAGEEAASGGRATGGPLPGARRWVVVHGSPLFAIGVALASVGYFVEALTYPRGTSSQPGPGLFPQFLAIAIFVAAVGTAITTRRPAPPVAAEEREHSALRPAVVVVGAVLFVSTIHPIGFLFAAAAALIVIELGMGVRNPFRVALFSLLLAFVAQVLFVDALGLTFFSNVHVLPTL